MKRVSEKEFVKFIKNYRGNKKVSLDSGVSPPMIVYTNTDTNKVIAQYPELTFMDGYSYKDMYYEVDEECLK